VLDELEKAGLVTLADEEHQGSTWAKVPYKGKNKPEPQKEPTVPTRSSSHSANAQTRKRAAQGMENPRQAPLLPIARRKTREAIHVLRLREA
jgi:hypothetical protein